MTFDWMTPPWQRYEDCTHMAVLLTDGEGGKVTLTTLSVRGDDATEALSDLLMGPGAMASAVAAPGLIGVVVRRGIDVMWMAQPPIEVESGSRPGEWTIGVAAGEAEVTAFSAEDTRGMLARLREQYGAE